MSDRSLGESINTWLQSAAIVCAALWAVLYTFVYKDIFVPASAPVNVSVNLHLKNVGSARAMDNLVAVEMEVTATNPSSRKIQLFPSIWYAMVNSVAGATPLCGADSKLQHPCLDGELPNVASAVEQNINRSGIWGYDAYADRGMPSMVAIGSLFSDGALDPGEAIHRDLIIYIPKNKGNLLNITTCVPNVSASHVPTLLFWKKAVLSIEWHLTKSGTPSPIVYSQVGNHPRQEISDKFENATNDWGYAYSMSEAEMPLWTQQ